VIRQQIQQSDHNEEPGELDVGLSFVACVTSGEWNQAEPVAIFSLQR